MNSGRVNLLMVHSGDKAQLAGCTDRCTCHFERRRKRKAKEKQGKKGGREDGRLENRGSVRGC